MATTTTINGFTIPQLSDAPNIETSINTFANAIDARVIPIFTTTTARNTAISAPTFGQAAAVSGTGEIYYYNGTAWVSLVPRCKIAGSHTTVTDSTTLTNVTNYNYSVEANSVYAGDGYLIINSNGTTGNDCKFGWTYPTGCTMMWNLQGPTISVSAESGNGIYTGALVQTDQPTFGTLTTAQVFRWCGTITTGGNAGTLQLQIAEGAAVAGVTSVACNLNSWIRMLKIA